MRIHEIPNVSFKDIRVEIVRPAARFGLWLQIYAISGSTVYHAHVEDGDLVFAEVAAHSYPDRPTLELDDELAEGMRKALAREPIYTRGEAALDHLKDAVGTRDRLLTLVEKLTERG